MNRNASLRLLIVCAVMLACVCSSAQATTYYVSKIVPPGGAGTSWATAQNTIAGALALCTGGDEIWVQRGNYTEAIVIPHTTGGIKLYGGFHGWESSPSDFGFRNFRTNPTVIDAAGTGTSAVTFAPGCSVSLDAIDGFVIKNGSTTGNGGGVHVNNASATIANNVICGNYAENGAAIAIEGTTVGSSVHDNEMYDNHAVTWGGAIWNSAAASEIYRNRIGSWTCNWPTNESRAGGGIYVSSADTYIHHNIISYNSCSPSMGIGGGGGIYLDSCGSSCVVANNQIDHHDANDDGCGVLIYKGAYGAGPVLANNTIYANWDGAGSHGNGIYLKKLIGPTKIINNIVAFNPPNCQIEQDTASGHEVLDNNCVYDPSIPLYVNVPIHLTDRNSDPLLATPCCCPDIYRIPVNSPCKDGGSAAALAWINPAVDLDNQPRVNPDPPGFIDIGADEYYPMRVLYADDATGNDSNDGLSPGTAKKHIQAAIDFAAAMDVVSVGAGTYCENLVMRPCVNLLGARGASVVDGSSKNTVITVPSGFMCNIVDMTMLDGRALQGGGINVCKNATPQIAGCQFLTCQAEMDYALFPNDPVGIGSGGGIYWAPGLLASSPGSEGSVGNCEFVGCKAQNSGLLAQPSIHACGAGVAIENSSPYVNNSMFLLNTADTDGAGVWVNGVTAKPTVTLNRISDGSAKRGGGIFVSNAADPLVCNNLIYGNRALLDPGVPGSGMGGGVYVLDPGALPTDRYGNYECNTIADNMATTASQVAVVGVGTGSIRTFANNIVYSTSAGIEAGTSGALVFTNNDFYPDLVGGALNLDPKFAGGYHLAWDSPCINAGTNNYVCSNLDFDNETRPTGPAIDMGADEFMWTPLTVAIATMHNSRYVNLQGLPVTAVLDGIKRLYVENSNRSRGVKVAYTGAAAVDIHVAANVAGTLQTGDDGERYIDASRIATTGPANLQPVMVTNKWIGGSSWNYDPVLGTGQQGIEGAKGLNNIGLLVKVWGRIVEREPASPATWFKIDDGSGVNLKCLVPPELTLEPTWTYACVTGVSSCEKVGPFLRPLVRVRAPDGLRGF